MPTTSKADLGDGSHTERVTKHDRVLSLLSRREGATIPDMMAATDWQRHSVRGFLAGTVKKKLGFTLTSKKFDGELRRYRIETKRGRRYRYYVSTALITGSRSDHAKGWRIPAGDVEALVLDRLRAFFASEPDVGEALSCFELDASTLRSALSRAMQLAEECATLPPIKIRELVRSLSRPSRSTMKRSSCRSSERRWHLSC